MDWFRVLRYERVKLISEKWSPRVLTKHHNSPETGFFDQNYISIKTFASRYKTYPQFSITKASSCTIAVLHLNDYDLEGKV